MKQLKFKAWHKKRKELLFGTAGKNGGLVFVKPTEMYDDEREEIGYRNVDLEILQFTGIKDITGREVYEADIVIDKSGTEKEVVYNPDLASYEPLNNINSNELKVVGSRYKLQL